MRVVLLPLVLLFTSCSTVRHNEAKRSPSSAPPAFSKTLKPLIEKWIKQDPEKMQDILNDLPEQHRKNFTLVRDSHSLQKSTDLKPRVIAFGNTGKTIFTFGGDPKLAGYSFLEIADFDENENFLNLYEVRFKKEAEVGSDDDYIVLTEDEVYKETENIQISRANPTKCMNCHSAYFNSGSQSIRFASYKWGSYPQWPRMYGKFDDSFSKQLFSKKLDDKQFQAFLNFKDAVKKSSDGYDRYNVLEFGKYQTSPYYMTKEDGRPMEGSPRREIYAMPNARLTIYLGILYSRMIARFIANEPEVQKSPGPFLTKWYCEGHNTPFEYPLSLGEDPAYWNTGVKNALDTKNVLSALIKVQTIYMLWPSNPSWKLQDTVERLDEEPYLRGLSSETKKFLVVEGVINIFNPAPSYSDKFCQSLRP